MKPAVRDTLTGLIVAAGVAGLIVILTLTGELRRFTQRTYEFSVQLDQAGGLSNTSKISFNGVLIGTVKEVSNHPDPTKGVIVRAQVHDEHQIPKSVVVALNQSLVGDVSLDLTLPPDVSPADAIDFVKPGEMLEYRKAETLFTRLGREVREPLEKLVSAAEGVRNFTDEYTRFGKRLNELAAPRSPDEIAGGLEVTVPALLARADRVLLGAEAWLGDDAMRTDARAAVASAKQAMDSAASIAERAEKTMDALDSTAKVIQEQATRAGDSVAAVGSDVRQTLTSISAAADDLRAITAAARRGEGTAGQLLTNPDLYNNLNAASLRLEKALEELRLLAEKYRKEGLPIKF